MIAGLLPAIESTRVDLTETLRDSSRGRHVRPVQSPAPRPGRRRGGAGRHAAGRLGPAHSQPDTPARRRSRVQVEWRAHGTRVVVGRPVRERRCASAVFRATERTTRVAAGGDRQRRRQFPARHRRRRRHELHASRDARPRRRARNRSPRSVSSTATTSARWGSRCDAGARFQSTDTGAQARVVIINEALAKAVVRSRRPLGRELVVSLERPGPRPHRRSRRRRAARGHGDAGPPDGVFPAHAFRVVSDVGRRAHRAAIHRRSGRRWYAKSSGSTPRCPCRPCSRWIR